MTDSAAKHRREASLPPQRWLAEEDLLYHPATNTLHRWGCSQLSNPDASTMLPAGASLSLVWAPVICGCHPDVTLALGSG
jgi:hypothetical protein